LKRDGVTTVPYLSVEEWALRIKAPVDPRAGTVEVGLADINAGLPTTWLPAAWTGQVLSGRYFATVEIGPLVKDRSYNAFARVSLGGQVPVIHAGVIEAY
jgi:hypothetical protein